MTGTRIDDHDHEGTGFRRRALARDGGAKFRGGKVKRAGHRIEAERSGANLGLHGLDDFEMVG